MTKTVYIIGHKGRSYINDKDWHIYFHAGMSNGAYDTTYDVTKAARFYSKDELFEFLNKYCYLRGTIIFDFTEEYLERIKDDENIKRIYNDCETY